MKGYYKKQKEFIEYVLKRYSSKNPTVKEFGELYHQRLAELEIKSKVKTEKRKSIKIANITQRLIVDALMRNQEYDLSAIKRQNEKQKIIERLKDKMKNGN